MINRPPPSAEDIAADLADAKRRAAQLLPVYRETVITITQGATHHERECRCPRCVEVASAMISLLVVISRQSES